MAAETIQPIRHQLDFILYNLPSTTIRIDFPTASRAENIMLSALPMIKLGAGYTDTATSISQLHVQPRRIELEIIGPPSQLPISLQITSDSPFVYGWLLVPEHVQTAIATVAQRIRIVGPGYWALPLGRGLRAGPRVPRPAAPAKAAERTPPERAGATPASAKPAGGAPAS